jgi:hypothetical protein
MRMAVAASVIWPAAMAAFMQPWKDDLFPITYVRLSLSRR